MVSFLRGREWEGQCDGGLFEGTDRGGELIDWGKKLSLFLPAGHNFLV